MKILLVTVGINSGHIAYFKAATIGDLEDVDAT